MEHLDYDFLSKVVFCGDSTVGKTCLLKRFMSGDFNECEQMTVGVDFEVTTIEVKGLHIWDTAGQKRFRTLDFYRDASLMVVVFDVTNGQSFSNVPSWIEEITKKTTANIPKMLVGNKCDLVLQRQVREEDGRSLAEKFGLTYMETSAKNASNLDELFNHIAAISIRVQEVSAPDSQQNLSFCTIL
eukprot:TRINITY_DN5124_c0_g1_i2.p1 TRINITY_DN5124_c0_g1~~TRINITY_DN5124_c0_g1_i2.p1  ORF type:complete len:186 (+),score=50.30 TRINITY_DN5124_c0_g1_i2:58-615(+)